LFTPDGTLKLADFGLAIDLNQERAVTRAGGQPARVLAALGSSWPPLLPQHQGHNSSTGQAIYAGYMQPDKHSSSPALAACLLEVAASTAE
jgi:hypothetical protein